ncbi:MAG: SLC26A/SulP transporter family protein [Terriglobia bacterium]
MTSKDAISGLVTPVVIITSTLSYAAMIFSGPLARGLPIGIGYGLVSAGIMAIVFAVGSGMPFAIAGPDSKPVAVLATLATVIAANLARRGHAADAPATVLFALIAGTLITGVTLYLFGVLRAGRWIRFVPYPVVAGFMAASGWLLAAGGIRILTGSYLSLDLLQQLLRGQHLIQLTAGLAFAIGIFLIKRVKHPLAFPALLIGGMMATHMALHGAGYSWKGAREAGWLLDLSTGAALPGPWLLKSMPKVDMASLLWAGGGYVALVAVTAMTLLLSLLAIEVQTRLDVDLDRELRLNGFANILVGLCGGMTGTLSASRTLFNYRSGARGRASGIIAGVVCLLTLAFGTKALGFVPVAILGALLLQLGAELLVEWLVKGWHTMQRADYIQMVVIFLVIVRWDFVAGVALGIVAACLTFAINTSRLRLVKLGLNRTVYSGRVDRPSYQHDELVRHGQSIQIMWLHSFVFFGSAHRLLLQIKEIVEAQRGSCRSLILDFRQVLGIDSSAVMSFVKLRQIADREGFEVVLSAVPPQVELALRAGGLLGDGDNSTCRVFPNIDSALEWCEDRLLTEIMTREEALGSADEWLAREIGSEPLFARLASYLEVVEYQPGDMLIQQGDAADSLYLLYAGRVTVLFRTPEGADLRLRSMVGHTIVGEMGLYRTLPRGASVRADQPTVAYRLSREAMTRMEQDDPTLAYAFHKLVIRTLAERLDFANREAASLQS